MAHAMNLDRLQTVAAFYQKHQPFEKFGFLKKGNMFFPTHNNRVVSKASFHTQAEAMYCAVALFHNRMRQASLSFMQSVKMLGREPDHRLIADQQAKVHHKLYSRVCGDCGFDYMGIFQP